MAITKAGKVALKLLEQIEIFEPLKLRDPTACGVAGDPWDGMSPREVLTRERERISLGHEGASLNAADAEIEEQCRRHLHGW